MRMAERFLTGETLKNDIGPKLNLLVERSNREIKGDGRTIMVNEVGNVISISRIGGNGGNGGGAGGGSADYSGPFAVVKKDDTHIRMPGYDLDDIFYHNYIDIGLRTPIDVLTADKEVTEDKWIYLKITFTSGYNAVIEDAADFPAQTDAALYIRLAYVWTSGGKISEIIQYQYGNINLIGRFL